MRRAIVGLVFFAGSPAAAPAGVVKNAHIVESAPPRELVTDNTTRAAGWAAQLGAVAVKMRNTGAHDKIRLYKDDGTLDDAEAKKFMTVAASIWGLNEPLPPRLVQLVMRASYHFKGASVTIVSATRKGSHGRHGTGEAIDFQLDGVRAATLAAFLRDTPRAGIGIYTHPKTQYVHLDVRDRSYHWIDGSPPGVTWREQLLPDPKQAKRDASYVPSMDLPDVR